MIVVKLISEAKLEKIIIFKLKYWLSRIQEHLNAVNFNHPALQKLNPGRKIFVLVSDVTQYMCGLV